MVGYMPEVSWKALINGFMDWYIPIGRHIMFDNIAKDVSGLVQKTKE